MPLVAFLSDFGYTDYYVAAVKAVIKRVCPVAEVVDVSHGVRSWSPAGRLLHFCRAASTISRRRRFSSLSWTQVWALRGGGSWCGARGTGS
uniref:S-adenosyl-l-methionine hydroxide adenosyltransferase N-terminal domain-containing protein n=1 Tax=Thermofilum pendens TaxID=2269 RepID=A0A7C1PDR7_THEPE